MAGCRKTPVTLRDNTNEGGDPVFFITTSHHLSHHLTEHQFPFHWPRLFDSRYEPRLILFLPVTLRHSIARLRKPDGNPMVPRENERDQNLDTYHKSQHRGEGRKWGVAYVPY